MADVSKSRLSLDLEEIERQLSRSSPQSAPSKSDPLAELARIVGQDDPFRALLAGEGPGATPIGGNGGGRREPFFEDHGHHDAGPYALRGSLSADEAALSHGYQDQPVALTAEEEAILRGHNHYAPEPHHGAPYYDDEPDYAESSYEPVQPRRSRKTLLAAGAVLAVGALAAVGALSLRDGNRASSNGEPPVVRADAGPLKIAPQNPGGIDIPNQNKKIYEPAAQETQTRVVNREEQPIDIRQAIRSGGSQPESGSGGGSVRLSPSVPPNAMASNGLASSVPGANQSINGVLGEPRRVRTVSIRPDGTIAGPEANGSGRASAPPAMATPAEAPRLSMPSVASGVSQPAQSASPQPQAPVRPRDVTSTSGALRTTSGAEPQTRAPLQITPDVARLRSEPRVPAQAALREPTETSAAPSTSSGFTVQLGVRNTDIEARVAFDQLQKRFSSDLSGFSPLIRQAEINGKTAYRVRVGPMSRDDATSLCARLKTSGGQCFVANN
jgi:hypothetical protein